MEPKVPDKEWPDDIRDGLREIRIMEAKDKSRVVSTLLIFFTGAPIGAATYGVISRDWTLFEHVWLPSLVGLSAVFNHYHAKRGAGPPIDRF